LLWKKTKPCGEITRGKESALKTIETGGVVITRLKGEPVGGSLDYDESLRKDASWGGNFCGKMPVKWGGGPLPKKEKKVHLPEKGLAAKTKERLARFKKREFHGMAEKVRRGRRQKTINCRARQKGSGGGGKGFIGRIGLNRGRGMTWGGSPRGGKRAKAPTPVFLRQGEARRFQENGNQKKGTGEEEKSLQIGKEGT